MIVTWKKEWKTRHQLQSIIMIRLLYNSVIYVNENGNGNAQKRILTDSINENENGNKNVGKNGNETVTNKSKTIIKRKRES